MNKLTERKLNVIIITTLLIVFTTITIGFIKVANNHNYYKYSTLTTK